MNDSVKELIFSLENSFATLESRIDILQDVETSMSQLRDSVDAATHRGKQSLWHHQHHRDLRILSELFRYVMEDITSLTEETSKVTDALIELAYDKGSGDPESSTTEQTNENYQRPLKKEKGNAS